MKRVLEDELISLAHRILKLKSRADIHQLKKEAGMLYEKLAVLSFAEKHFGGIKPTIGKTEFSDAFYSQYSHIDEDGDHRSPDGTEYNPEPISEPNTEKIKDIVSHMPPEAEQVDYLMNQFKKLSATDFSELEEKQELHQDTEVDQQKEEEDSQEDLEDKTQESVEKKADEEETIQEKPTQEEEKQDFQTQEELQTNQGEIDDEQPVDSSPKEKQESETEQNTEEKASEASSFEQDFGVHFDDLPFFEPKKEDEQEYKSETLEEKNSEPEVENSSHREKETQEEPLPDNIKKQQPKRTIDLFNQDKKSLNDRLQVGFQIGLNDRLAFTKALFDNNVEDYNRVMSQISTLNSFEEAQNFIDHNIKPEYNNWEDKADTYKRFMNLLKRKFEA
ncbi:hypothetical protein [Psychroflexus halocasei]|uniref:Uncharacterized protein n=1 Tax=Psychroflexus halocasei TaxID=908615 RepID=A0A1H3W3B1_9FLAO|nr:hypothetical protein [Psychroflexus halocasei]SDZ80832.1 hypothetical protein SAMN05421540_101380 [Psychroflexus halocasei]